MGLFSRESHVVELLCLPDIFMWSNTDLGTTLQINGHIQTNKNIKSENDVPNFFLFYFFIFLCTAK